MVKYLWTNSVLDHGSCAPASPPTQDLWITAHAIASPTVVMPPWRGFYSPGTGGIDEMSANPLWANPRWLLADQADRLLAEAAAQVHSDEVDELLDEAGAILSAEQARLHWLHRLAGLDLVSLRTWGQQPIAGCPELVGSDALMMRLYRDTTSRGPRWAIIPVDAVMAVEQLPSRLADEGSTLRTSTGHRPSSTRALPWSLAQMLRSYVGWRILFCSRDGTQQDGQLELVGADHLDMRSQGDGSTWTMPFAALSFVLVMQG